MQVCDFSITLDAPCSRGACADRGDALLFVVGRWYVATQRVQDVATHAAQSIAPVIAKAPPTPCGALLVRRKRRADRGGYRLPESAGRATIHLHAIAAYASRQERDLAALPPPNLPLDRGPYPRS